MTAARNAPEPLPAGSERRALRSLLLAQRDGLPAATRAAHAARISATLDRLLTQHPARVIGAYWPMRAEPDIRALLTTWYERGHVMALPQVVARAAPLQFVRWTPASRLLEERTGARIADPAAEVVEPDLLVIPCVGFDAARYRLGYGGGYYDRTLAARARQTPMRPVRTWGLAYECSRLPDLRPEPHDVPLDLIITEAGIC